jgi:hypothetical protein
MKKAVEEAERQDAKTLHKKLLKNANGAEKDN